MYPEIDTKQPEDVKAVVESIYSELFPNGSGGFVEEAFQIAIDCFSGKHKDYQAIDAIYHDLEHTMQGTLCMARLLRGYSRAQEQPPIPQRMFELGILAILLHDTGYLKKKGDNEGTGAKFTLVHVKRS